MTARRPPLWAQGLVAVVSLVLGTVYLELLHVVFEVLWGNVPQALDTNNLMLAAYVLVMLTEIAHELDKPEKAREAAVRALEQGSSGTRALLRLGELHERRGEIDEAMWCYQKVLDAQPDHARTRMRLAELQLKILWEEILKRGMKIEVLSPPKRVYSSFVHGYSELMVKIA